MMRALVLALTTIIFVSGCKSIPPQTTTNRPPAPPSSIAKSTDAVRYDLGRLSGPWNFVGFPISGIDVSAVPWLRTTEIQYRLEYEDEWQRRTYTDAQWAASPDALLERFLIRRIVFRQNDQLGKGCHLHFSLHELEHTYLKPDQSHVTLEVLAVLQPERDGKILAKRAFYIQKAAPTLDARGSVAATREAVQTVSSSVDDWLSDIERNAPIVANLCRGI